MVSVLFSKQKPSLLYVYDLKISSLAKRIKEKENFLSRPKVHLKRKR
jgi:hypothetical protein